MSTVQDHKTNEMYAIAKPRIDQKSLKCHGNNCEFYGNAKWENCCSKCYREKVLKDRLAQGKASSIKCHVSLSKFLIIPANRSKFNPKGVLQQQQTSSKHHEAPHHSTSSPTTSGEDKKFKKRNILEVFKKTTSLTSSNSFKELKKQHHLQHKHIDRVLEPVAMAHLEMLKVLSINDDNWVNVNNRLNF